MSIYVFDVSKLNVAEDISILLLILCVLHK